MAAAIHSGSGWRGGRRNTQRKTAWNMGNVEGWSSVGRHRGGAKRHASLQRNNIAYRAANLRAGVTGHPIVNQRPVANATPRHLRGDARPTQRGGVRGIPHAPGRRWSTTTVKRAGSTHVPNPHRPSSPPPRTHRSHHAGPRRRK
jgi:hypothetical protein